MGHTHVNNLFKIMDLPGFTYRTYKKVEREVANVVDKVCKDSCVAAVQEEREQTILNNDMILSLL